MDPWDHPPVPQDLDEPLPNIKITRVWNDDGFLKLDDNIN
jgi:hypothetical protein